MILTVAAVAKRWLMSMADALLYLVGFVVLQLLAVILFTR